MLNNSFREYEKFSAAQNICAVNNSKDICDEENDEGIGAWNTATVLQVNHCQQLPQYFIKVSARTQLGFLDTEGSKITQYSIKASASTQSELLDSEENNIKQIIMRIQFLAYSLHNQKLLNIVERVVTLLKDAKEEDEFSTGIMPGSLLNFFAFISKHSDLKRPKLSLTPENNIYASWKIDKDKVFSAHFLEKGDVRFVIFKPSDRHPDKPIRLSGIAPVDDLMQEVLIPHGISWARE